MQSPVQSPGFVNILSAYQKIKACTVNNEGYIGEKPWQFIGHYNVRETFMALHLIRTKTTFCTYIGTQNGFSKICGKTFMFCRKV